MKRPLIASEQLIRALVEGDEVVLLAFHCGIEIAGAGPPDAAAGGVIGRVMSSRTVPPKQLALVPELARLLGRLEKALAHLLRLLRALEAGEAGFERDEAAAALNFLRQ